MSELNRELTEYLSRNGTRTEDKEPLLPITVQDLKFTKVTSWFSKNNEQAITTPESDSPGTTESTWFSIPKNDGYCTLGRKQRLTGFSVCLLMGVICYSLALMYIPFLLIKALKFSLLFTLGSTFSLSSFMFLWGPVNYIQHLFSKDKLLFTIAYLGSLGATLFFALSLKSTVLTVIAAIVQVYALLGFLLTSLPGGTAGIKFMFGTCSSICKGTVSKVFSV